MRLLGQILIDLRYITQEDLDNALSEQKTFSSAEKPLLGELLVKKELISKAELIEAFKISLTEVINDEDAKGFVKEAYEITLKKLAENIDEKYGKFKLTEEGKLALITRKNNLLAKIESIKSSLNNQDGLKVTEFRKVSTQNHKKELIDLENKLDLIGRDIRLFC